MSAGRPLGTAPAPLRRLWPTTANTPRHAGAMAGRVTPVRLSLALRTNREAGVRRVLLLNVTYEPLTTVGLRRAVCLVLGEKAEVVHDDAEGNLLRSTSVVLAMPSVIRLRRYVRVPYRSRVPLTRGALMRRDNYQCAYCGHRAETIDHVLPRSRGGAHTWENCVASCMRCNHSKADRLVEELGWTMRCVPAVPRGAHWRLIGAAHDGDPQWAAYLAESSAA
jgi:5-methylcytosine-specific restriction endonuclease McrA